MVVVPQQGRPEAQQNRCASDEPRVAITCPTPNSNRTVRMILDQSRSVNLQRHSLVIANLAAIGANHIDTTCSVC